MNNSFKNQHRVIKTLISIYKNFLNSHTTFVLLLILLIIAIWILYNPSFINEVVLSIVFTKPVNNIKKNNLSLKQLQAELEQLKNARKDSHDKKDFHSKDDHTDKHNDSNQNITIRMFRRSMIPGALALYWWLITAVIRYGDKIPIVSKFINILSLWYGRTTWWKILISVRKAFVIFNAIIGVFTVFKITGFSTYNLIAGCYGIGVTYLEMFLSFVRRLFGWFLDLFDYKIVPKPPTHRSVSLKPWEWWNGPKQNTWYGGKMGIDNGFNRIIDASRTQDWYQSPFVAKPTSTAEWSFKTWLYYGFIGLVTFGTLYIGIKIFNEPTAIKDFFLVSLTVLILRMYHQQELIGQQNLK